MKEYTEDERERGLDLKTPTPFRFRINDERLILLLGQEKGWKLVEAIFRWHIKGRETEFEEEDLKDTYEFFKRQHTADVQDHRENSERQAKRRTGKKEPRLTTENQ